MIVEIKGLIKRYKDFLALDNVNLSIQEGEIFGLLGPNGAGKTTTINTLLGLTKIDQGEIKIFNKDLKIYENEIKKNIGIVPQDIAVYEELTAYENVTFFGRLYGLRDAELKEKVKIALEFTGLWDQRKGYPGKYSGGMKRRLNIACAIVHQPKLIIMDEPTVGIDPQSRKHILESVKKLNQMGSTIIYTSHYMEEIQQICTKIGIMDHGRVIAGGTLEELKALIEFEDRIEFNLSSVNHTIMDELKKISGVTECMIQETEVTILSEKNSKNLGQIVDTILKNGAEIITMNIETPTLEGVFLTLTGRSLRK